MFFSQGTRDLRGKLFVTCTLHTRRPYLGRGKVAPMQMLSRSSSGMEYSQEDFELVAAVLHERVKSKFFKRQAHLALAVVDKSRSSWFFL